MQAVARPLKKKTKDEVSSPNEAYTVYDVDDAGPTLSVLSGKRQMQM